MFCSYDFEIENVYSTDNGSPGITEIGLGLAIYILSDFRTYLPKS